MKKVGKSSKKGFTLVELIVVLVILAVLAAMLVPALTGYIKKAREEKEYQTASTIYTAAQAIVTEKYGKNLISAAGTQDIETDSTKEDAVIALSGVDKKLVTDYKFAYGADAIIGSQATTGGASAVTKDGYTFPTHDGYTAYGYVCVSGSYYVFYINTTSAAPLWDVAKKAS